MAASTRAVVAGATALVVAGAVAIGEDGAGVASGVEAVPQAPTPIDNAPAKKTAVTRRLRAFRRFARWVFVSGASGVVRKVQCSCRREGARPVWAVRCADRLCD